MTLKVVIGLDGHSTGEKALDHGRRLAEMAGDCELIVAFVIEWSPFSFQTAEENAERHKRREEEISQARDRVVAPAVEQLTSGGFSATGRVRHGNVADALDAIAAEEGAHQIVVARSSDNGLSSRIFGSSTANLVMHARVPVTVVP